MASGWFGLGWLVGLVWFSGGWAGWLVGWSVGWLVGVCWRGVFGSGCFGSARFGLGWSCGFGSAGWVLVGFGWRGWSGWFGVLRLAWLALARLVFVRWQSLLPVGPGTLF